MDDVISAFLYITFDNHVHEWGMVYIFLIKFHGNVYFDNLIMYLIFCILVITT